MRTWAVLVLAFSFSLGTATVSSRCAWAQLTSQQKQEVRQHYEKATRAYDVGKYEEAISEYQHVYEISGDSKMLYNIGQAYRLNGQSEQAARFYRRYLQRLPNASNREDVEKKIADQERMAEEQKAAAAAALATAAAAAAPAPAAPAPQVVVPTPPPNPPPPPKIPEGTSGGRIASYICMAAGGVGLGTAAVAGIVAKNKGDQLTRDSRNGNTVFQPGLESQGQTWDKVALGAAIGGGALAVLGGILFLASGDGGSQQEAHSEGRFVALPTIGPDGAGVAAALTF